jgi:hypothetical protein
MAQFNQAFDASTITPDAPREVLPDGDYPVIIEASEWKATKAGTGQFLELTLQVIEGPQKGRKVWDRLNLSNPNTQAVEIAQRTLSAICHATGVMKVSDSAQLHNLPLLAKVKVSQGPNGPSNEVKGYKKLDGVVGSVTPAAVPMVTSSAPAVAPWQRKAS